MKGWTQQSIDRLNLKTSEKEKVKKTRDKVKTLAQLIAELDKQFSLYIRQREADENGLVKCFTSGRLMHWKDSHCGHFHSRRYNSTRWDERNCQVQSVAENIFHEGNKPMFAQKLIIKYGPDILDELEMKKNNRFKLERFYLELLIEEYRNKVKQLNHV